MLETLLALSIAVTGAVEFFKSMLMQTSVFTGLSEQAQSAALQFIAFVFGIVAAFSGNVNVLSTLPAYSGAPQWIGIIITGLLVSTGSAGLHVLLALLGIRGEVTASVSSGTPKAQAAGATTRRDYAGWQ